MPLSTFLNGRVPTRLRGLKWLSLSDTGNVLTAAATSDSGGGATISWSAGAAVPCRIDPLAGREDIRASRISDESTHVLTVPAGTSISTANRFAITGRGTFDILAERDRTDEWTGVFEVNSVS